jgi:hypothetical protein
LEASSSYNFDYIWVGRDHGTRRRETELASMGPRSADRGFAHLLLGKAHPPSAQHEVVWFLFEGMHNREL